MSQACSSSADLKITAVTRNPKAHVILSRLSGESRNPETSTTLDPGFRRGDDNGHTRTMKSITTRPPPYVSFWGVISVLKRAREIL